MDYLSKGHYKYYLKYHIIFVCKYRKKLLSKLLIGNFMKQVMLKLAKEKDFSIKALETDEDHLHMFISSIPTISVSSIVRLLKQQSTIAVWKNYNNELKNHFWKEKTFWTDGYFVSSVGQIYETFIKKYIATRG